MHGIGKDEEQREWRRERKGKRKGLRIVRYVSERKKKEWLERKGKNVTKCI